MNQQKDDEKRLPEELEQLLYSLEEFKNGKIMYFHDTQFGEGVFILHYEETIDGKSFGYRCALPELELERLQDPSVPLYYFASFIKRERSKWIEIMKGVKNDY
jgi:hypothetical protein